MEEDPPFIVNVADDCVGSRQSVPLDVVAPPLSHSTSSSITPLSSNADHKAMEHRATDRGKSFTHCYQRNNKRPQNSLNLQGSSTNIPRTSKFTLPKGWSVKKVLRRVGGLSDKYYREPETGRQFRSLKEVERYVTEGVTPPTSKVKKSIQDEKVGPDISEGVTRRPTRVKRLKYHHDEKNSGSQPLIVAGGKLLDMEEDKDNQQLAIVSPTSVSPRPHPELPDGWVVEEVPRRARGYVDKYYYEPGTGQKFRSMLAVKKYLSELEENSPLSVVLEEIKEKNLPLSRAFKLSSPIKHLGSYNSWKNSISKKEKPSSSFGSPPSKINWVISGNGGDAWNAFEDETLVADSVKQHWGNTFMMAINSKHNVAVSG